MATGGDWTLDDSTITRLAADISINDMVTVAESYMKMSPEKIKNLRDENRGSAEAVNREILRTWIYRFPGPHHRLVSANHTVIIIGGSNWAPKMHPLCRSNFFRFHACFGEKWPNNIVSQPFLELAPRPSEILDSPLIIVETEIHFVPLTTRILVDTYLTVSSFIRYNRTFQLKKSEAFLAAIKFGRCRAACSQIEHSFSSVEINNSFKF